MICGNSSHKDSDHLLKFVAEAENSLKEVFVVMGELKSSTFLAQKISGNLNIKAVCPELNQTVTLDF
jgi:predicted metal-dependent RNase